MKQADVWDAATQFVDRFKREAEALRNDPSHGMTHLAANAEIAVSHLDKVLAVREIDREELARTMFAASHARSINAAPREVSRLDSDRIWDENARMPLTGPGFTAYWYGLADAAVSILNS